MVGGMVPGKLHFRVNWKWRALLNLCAYSVKDPSTLTHHQRFTRLYKACLRRHHLINIMRLRWATANHKNFFEHAEKCRKDFENARTMKPEDLELFMRECEEWLELTFFPAVSQWPVRVYTNKFHLNVPYPEPFHDYDPAGYYKPRPIFGTSPTAGPYYHEYPRNPHFFSIDETSPRLEDPYLDEHLNKIEDPEMREKAANKL